MFTPRQLRIRFNRAASKYGEIGLLIGQIHRNYDMTGTVQPLWDGSVDEIIAQSHELKLTCELGFIKSNFKTINNFGDDGIPNVRGALNHILKEANRVRRIIDQGFENYVPREISLYGDLYDEQGKSFDFKALLP